eukprot:TRINITY_DN6133_c0_g4_i2.p1 TRINITY_DN6133_c0_g4~~TRINITY_DN6133_c0_g4_i2.p1  ORF type:complete len:609 (+),score=133.25 TRINITY_DN6133_c0_g4_i2:8-1834(+)
MIPRLKTIDDLAKFKESETTKKLRSSNVSSKHLRREKDPMLTEAPLEHKQNMRFISKENERTFLDFLNGRISLEQFVEMKNFPKYYNNFRQAIKRQLFKDRLLPISTRATLSTGRGSSTNGFEGNKTVRFSDAVEEAMTLTSRGSRRFERGNSQLKLYTQAEADEDTEALRAKAKYYFARLRTVLKTHVRARKIIKKEKEKFDIKDFKLFEQFENISKSYEERIENKDLLSHDLSKKFFEHDDIQYTKLMRNFTLLAPVAPYRKNMVVNRKLPVKEEGGIVDKEGEMSVPLRVVARGKLLPHFKKSTDEYVQNLARSNIREPPRVSAAKRAIVGGEKTPGGIFNLTSTSAPPGKEPRSTTTSKASTNEDSARLQPRVNFESRRSIMINSPTQQQRRRRDAALFNPFMKAMTSNYDKQLRDYLTFSMDRVKKLPILRQKDTIDEQVLATEVFNFDSLYKTALTDEVSNQVLKTNVKGSQCQRYVNAVTGPSVSLYKRMKDHFMKKKARRTEMMNNEEGTQNYFRIKRNEVTTTEPALHDVQDLSNNTSLQSLTEATLDMLYTESKDLQRKIVETRNETFPRRLRQLMKLEELTSNIITVNQGKLEGKPA